MTTEEQHEDRVRRATVDAVAGLEGPDRARLARIEQRLLAKARRPRTRPWWWLVVGLGLAAGATAGYWLTGTGSSARVDFREEAAPAAANQGESREQPHSAREDDQAAGTDAAQDGDKDPVIYIGE